MRMLLDIVRKRCNNYGLSGMMRTFQVHVIESIYIAEIKLYTSYPLNKTYLEGYIQAKHSASIFP